MPLCAALVAGAGGASPWPPLKLSETGLYRDATKRTLAGDVWPYAPQYPLWTDGETKQRWVALPQGSTIDASDPQAWRFPAGTRFWKEFSWGARRIETRYLEKRRNGAWVFATYQWNDDQTEATLAPAATGVTTQVEVAPGQRHDIPSVGDCRACHEAQNRDPVLGFEALQLSPERDPLAPHAEAPPPGSLDLAALLKEGRLKNAPLSWRTAAPVIAADSPRARAVLGYLHGNCGHCHNDRDALSSVGLSLRAELAATSMANQPVMRTALGVLSKFQLRGVAPHDAFRLAPGDVERSAVVVRMRSRDGLSQMPPLGSKVVDTVALELISAWVREDLATLGHVGAR
jgi:hypothetical protein